MNTYVAAVPGQPPQMAGAVPLQYAPGQVPVNGLIVDGSGQPVVAVPQSGQPQVVGSPQVAAVPAPVPHPTLGFAPGQLAQPIPVPVAVARTQFTGAEILDGPGIPVELRGRTVTQAMDLYSKLIDHYSKTKPAPVVSGQPAPAIQQPGVVAAPVAGQPLPPPQSPVQATSFWRTPEASMEAVVEKVVQKVMGPSIAVSQATAIQSAEEQAKRTIPDYPAIQEELQSIISTAAPEHLTNPAFWTEAADLARGRLLRKAQITGQPAAPPVAMPAYSAPYGVPAGPQAPVALPSVPASMAVPGYFAEGPTPPQGYGAPYTGQLTAYQSAAAKGFGMDPAEYSAWSAPSSTAPVRRY